MSMRNRQRLVDARHRLRQTTGGWRALPDLLVIGTQRGGTSSLYRYLGRHPQVVPSLRKETQYFSTRYALGERWYRANFPSRFSVERDGSVARIGFEATPDYMLHPMAAERAAALVPNAKVIALVRDPVERAYSHYRHMVRLGFEDATFGDALANEDRRLRGETEKLIRDPSYPAKALLRFSYFARGKYAEHLEPWIQHYPLGDQLLVIQSEEFFRETAACFAAIQSFLGLDVWMPERFGNYSYAQGRIMPSDEHIDPNVRRELAARFEPWNERLSVLLSRDFDWT